MDVEGNRRSVSRVNSPPRDAPSLTEREEHAPSDFAEVAQWLQEKIDIQREKALQRITRGAEAAEPSKAEKTSKKQSG